MIWFGSDLDTTTFGDDEMNPLKALGLLKSAQKCMDACTKDGSLPKLQALIPQLKSALDVIEAEYPKPHIQQFIKDVNDSGVMQELQASINTPVKAKMFLAATEEALAGDLTGVTPTVKASAPATDGHPHQEHDVPPAVAKFAATVQQLNKK